MEPNDPKDVMGRNFYEMNKKSGKVKYTNTHNRMTLSILSLYGFPESSEKWNMFPTNI